MAQDSLFRIFSMTKPIVWVGTIMLVEQGRFSLDDAVAQWIPELPKLKVGIERNGKRELVPVTRQITVADLLRHTSGLTYGHVGTALVKQGYQQSRRRSCSKTSAGTRP